MVSMQVAELTADNLRAATKLRLRPEQEGLVAPVVESVAEAYVNPTAWPRVIYHGDEVIGFVMANFDPGNDLEPFRAGVWRLNIDANAQGQGAGRFAVDQVIAEARRRDVSKISVLWKRGTHGPEGFYLRLGFVPTGELFGEIVGYLLV